MPCVYAGGQPRSIKWWSGSSASSSPDVLTASAIAITLLVLVGWRGERGGDRLRAHVRRDGQRVMLLGEDCSDQADD